MPSLTLLLFANIEVRFHNYVVENLAAINENGRFNKPSDGLPEEYAKKAWEKYDNDLFQTGRLYDLIAILKSFTGKSLTRTVLPAVFSSTLRCMTICARL